MKKIIDLGCHIFEGLNSLLKKELIDHSYEAYCFEANPYVYRIALEKIEENRNKFKYLNLYNYAISNKSEKVKLNLDESKVNFACNILEKPPSEDIHGCAGINQWTQIQVESISAEVLFDICNIKFGDEVKIKCDIEGTEFLFLFDLLNINRISCVNEILVEWHERFWSPNQEDKIKEKNYLISQFENKKILMRSWD